MLKLISPSGAASFNGTRLIHTAASVYERQALSSLKSRLGYFKKSDKIIKHSKYEDEVKNRRIKSKIIQTGLQPYSRQKTSYLLKNDFGYNDTLEQLRESDINNPKIVRILQSNDQRLIYSYLGISGSKLTDSVIVQTKVGKLLAKDQVAKALFFCKLAKKRGIVGMNDVMKYYLEKGNVKLALDVYTWRRRWNIPSNEHTFTILFKGFSDVKGGLTENQLKKIDRLYTNLVDDYRNISSIDKTSMSQRQRDIENSEDDGLLDQLKGYEALEEEYETPNNEDLKDSEDSEGKDKKISASHTTKIQLSNIHINSALSAMMNTTSIELQEKYAWTIFDSLPKYGPHSFDNFTLSAMFTGLLNIEIKGKTEEEYILEKTQKLWDLINDKLEQSEKRKLSEKTPSGAFKLEKFVLLSYLTLMTKFKHDLEPFIMLQFLDEWFNFESKLLRKFIVSKKIQNKDLLIKVPEKHIVFKPSSKVLTLLLNYLSKCENNNLISQNDLTEIYHEVMFKFPFFVDEYGLKEWLETFYKMNSFNWKIAPVFKKEIDKISENIFDKVKKNDIFNDPNNKFRITVNKYIVKAFRKGLEYEPRRYNERRIINDLKEFRKLKERQLIDFNNNKKSEDLIKRYIEDKKLSQTSKLFKGLDELSSKFFFLKSFNEQETKMFYSYMELIDLFDENKLEIKFKIEVLNNFFQETEICKLKIKDIIKEYYNSKNSEKKQFMTFGSSKAEEVFVKELLCFDKLDMLRIIYLDIIPIVMGLAEDISKKNVQIEKKKELLDNLHEFKLQLFEEIKFIEDLIFRTYKEAKEKNYKLKGLQKISNLKADEFIKYGSKYKKYTGFSIPLEYKKLTQTEKLSFGDNKTLMKIAVEIEDFSSKIRNNIKNMIKNDLKIEYRKRSPEYEELHKFLTNNYVF
ncbi:Mrx1p ASCRUDRAFT_77592 [Ascoidea rubescens DSM 1968]|uniref:Mitochondrial group I intron splicing factor CCM1 n=1 Tax=Ascoidea rubescens DSM 1968 TaxID=1344418 RepID=A0A1D2VB23_9ASCO|nr:hypothetical protein ASCRUDRAFT_77592 [Ascoidea rubescens DSM 1968]ODV58868.1 hypothetical protein ASCRUDRAFT_77592 [Ascoidea rubescens DSM 1968]